MLCFGTASTITSKYLDEERAPIIPVSEGCYFFIHPYFQTALMFLGETSCYLGLFVKKWLERRKREREGLEDTSDMVDGMKVNTNISPMLLTIPAACDLCASSLTFVALTMVPASVY